MTPTSPSPRSSVGTAPVSFGVYGRPDHEDATRYNPPALLTAMRRAGHVATELGPPGYFGPVGGLHSLLRDHGMGVAGAYAAVRFSQPEYLPSDFQAALQTIEELAVFVEDRPKLILADGGNAILEAHPARSDTESNLGLTRDGWRRLVAITGELAQRAEDVGVGTAFHPHLSTGVETPAEVQRLLSETELSLAFDTGHLHLGGLDILEGLHRWRDRISHVHIKDVSRLPMTTAITQGKRTIDNWWDAACVPLGAGEVPLGNFLDELIAGDYQGWMIIEQDRAPGPVSEYPAIADVEARNLDWLESRLSRSRSAG